MPKKKQSITRRQDFSDSRSLRVMPWWWAVAGTTAAIILGIACLLVVWVIAGRSAALQIEAIKVGLSVTAGIGGACALLLAFRRQLHSEYVAYDTAFDSVQRRVTELYAKAVEQLGHDSAAVRLGGLYALERLAQDNKEHRQTVTDVICAYLRMPFEWEIEEGQRPGTQSTIHPQEASARLRNDEEPRQELQVRITAQRLLSRHLEDPSFAGLPTPFWGDVAIDLKGAHLINVDFSRCHFGNADFSDAEFSGATWFDETYFEGLNDFDRARFHGDAWLQCNFEDEAHFIQAHFEQKASFRHADFAGGADFTDARFDGDADFQKAKFDYAGFEGAEFGGEAKFCQVHFGWVKFNSAKFNGSEPNFNDATAAQRVPKDPMPQPWNVRKLHDGTFKFFRPRTRPSAS